MAIEWKQLEPFGVEVQLDSSQRLSSSEYAELRQLYAQHHLLLFRNQDITPAEQVRFAKQFGPVSSLDSLNFITYVSNTRPDGNFGLADANQALSFHHDGPFTSHPALGILFFAVDVVNGASSTLFANGALAYDRLSEQTRARIKGMQTLNVWTVDAGGRNRNRDVPPQFPRTVHPLVWKHPTTGRPFLFACSQSSDCILGLDEEESESLLAELWQAEFAEDAIYEHVWQQGDLLLIDNHVLQHARSRTDRAGTRTLQRVTLAEKSFGDLYPEFDVAGILGTSGKKAVSLVDGYAQDTGVVA